MRDMLIQEVYRLADIIDEGVVEDLRTWSNKDLLDYYGDLRIDEYFHWFWEEDGRETKTETR